MELDKATWKHPTAILFMSLCILTACKGYVQKSDEVHVIHSHLPRHRHEQQSEYIRSYHIIMDTMHREMMAVNEVEDDDINFLRQMIPHHKGAVDMAEAILESTQDRRIRNLALGMITEQKNEIEIMQRLIQKIKNAKDHELH